MQAAKTKYEHYLSIRRENREFARKQAQKHGEILAQVEAELNLPKSLRRYATKSMDNSPALSQSYKTAALPLESGGLLYI